MKFLMQEELLQSILTSIFKCFMSNIEIVLNAIYVCYTIKTFIQIKRQTDLQLNAYLTLDLSIFNNLEGLNINKNYIQNSLNNEWKKIMMQSFPELNSDEQIFDGNYLSISLTNYGNTEVKKIVLNGFITIQNSKTSVDDKKLIPQENKNISFEMNEIVSKGETKIFALLPTASFPIFSVNLSVNHIDVRDNSYPIKKLEFKSENNYIK